jgi:hypothetical protein
MAELQARFENVMGEQTCKDVFLLCTSKSGSEDSAEESG